MSALVPWEAEMGLMVPYPCVLSAQVPKNPQGIFCRKKAAFYFTYIIFFLLQIIWNVFVHLFLWVHLWHWMFVREKDVLTEKDKCNLNRKINQMAYKGCLSELLALILAHQPLLPSSSFSLTCHWKCLLIWNVFFCRQSSFPVCLFSLPFRQVTLPSVSPGLKPLVEAHNLFIYLDFVFSDVPPSIWGSRCCFH